MRDDPLLRVLANPADFFALPDGEKDLLIREARRLLLLGYIGNQLAPLPDYEALPARLKDMFFSARILGESYERMLRWEAEQLRRVLQAEGIAPILLKGAAYLLQGLPFANSRLASDVDILVAEEQLAEVEAALKAAGWRALKVRAYDQMYYREWMHELPPLRHHLRGTVVDVHHTIMPRTARLKPPAAKLLAAAVPLGDAGLRALSAEDTVLHKVVHHFFHGEFDNSLRELVDLDGLLKAYGAQAGFWDRLTPRAQEMDLTRPLYYGLRYSVMLLKTPVPQRVMQDIQVGRPNPLAAFLMDLLAPRALMPDHPDKANRLNKAARWCLYIRSHWIRMPPLMLAKHLLVKGWLRRKDERAAPASS